MQGIIVVTITKNGRRRKWNLLTTKIFFKECENFVYRVRHRSQCRDHGGYEHDEDRKRVSLQIGDQRHNPAFPRREGSGLWRIPRTWLYRLLFWSGQRHLPRRQRMMCWEMIEELRCRSDQPPFLTSGRKIAKLSSSLSASYSLAIWGVTHGASCPPLAFEPLDLEDISDPQLVMACPECGVVVAVCRDPTIVSHGCMLAKHFSDIAPCNISRSKPFLPPPRLGLVHLPRDWMLSPYEESQRSLRCVACSDVPQQIFHSRMLL